jgi:hypothetical protein
MRSDRRIAPKTLARAKPWLAAVVWAALALLASAARGEVVERILAVVDGRPLMLSEVRLVGQLRGLDEAEALEALVDEQLMLREAARLAQSVVTAEDEQRAYESLLARHPAASALPEAELRRLVRRQTTILKYVDFRFRPQVQVADAAVRQEYEKQFGTRPDAPAYEAAAGEIRRELESRELDGKIEAWVKDLRSAAEIRYNP